MALRFAKAGEEVIIGSRDVKKALNTVDLVKNILNEEISNVSGTTNSKAAAEGDIVILTVPLRPRW